MIENNSRKMENKLKGKVESIKELSYQISFKSDNSYIKSKRERINFGFGRYGSNEVDFISFLDKNGKDTEIIFFESNDKVINKIVFERDKRGRIIREVYILPDGTKDSEAISEYSYQGRLMFVRLYDENGLIEEKDYRYNIFGRLKSVNISGKFNNFIYRYNYNNKQYGSDYLVIVYKNTMKFKVCFYDKENRLLREEMEDDDSEQLWINEYKYNEMGYICSTETYLEHSQHSNLIRFSYQYDDNNNWIKKFVYLGRSKAPCYLIEREISYY